MAEMPTLTLDEAAGLLDELLAKDVEIEDLKRGELKAKTAYNLARELLKDAQEARDKLSYEIRNPSPLFDRPAPRQATTTAYDADVAAGVRAAEEVRDSGYDWDLDTQVSPESMPSLISAPAMKALDKPATPLGGKVKKSRKPRKAKGARA